MSSYSRTRDAAAHLEDEKGAARQSEAIRAFSNALRAYNTRNLKSLEKSLSPG